jgi:hypothetical protein
VQETRFSRLSEPRQTLIRLCQRVNYESIMNVQVADGDVCLDTSPEVLVDIKLDEDVTRRQELDLMDFALPVESCRLLAKIDFLTDGVVERIVVHDGLPRRVVLGGASLRCADEPTH